MHFLCLQIVQVVVSLDIMILIITDKNYKLRSSTLCNFLQSSVTSSVLHRPKYSLQRRFSNFLNPRSSLTVPQYDPPHPLVPGFMFIFLSCSWFSQLQSVDLRPHKVNMDSPRRGLPAPQAQVEAMLGRAEGGTGEEATPTSSTACGRAEHRWVRRQLLCCRDRVSQP